MCTGPGGETAVLKTAWSKTLQDELKLEWSVYQRLQSLQGKRIPYAFTLASPMIQDGLCMAVQYVGTTATKEDLGKPNVREAVFAAFQAVWDAGVLHGDPKPGNIIIGDEEVFLIDFACSVMDYREKGFGYEEEKAQVESMLRSSGSGDSCTSMVVCAD